MKNIKKIILIIIIIFITFCIFKVIKKEHTVKYKIDKYSIKEHFYISNDHYYDLIIKDKKNTYIYTLNIDLNKNKKIIKNIEEFKSNELTCIVSTYKKSDEKGIYCNLNKQQVSIDYLLNTNNSDFKKINKELKKYNLKFPKENNTKKYYKNLIIYQKNIPNDNLYFIWNYKGVYVIGNNKVSYKKFLDYDLYDNVMDCVVSDYYVLFDNSSVNGIENVYYYDINKDKVTSFKLKQKLTKDSYINGVVEDLIYVTDRKQKKEYTINIKDKTIEEIDNDQTKYLVYDNYKKKELSKSDYFMNDVFFDNNLIVDKKVTNSKELKKEYNYYYFIEENKLYKALDTVKSKKILLAELDNIKDWLVKDREVILLVDDTIYSYTEQYGLRKILITNELNYNYENIYEMWKK